MSHRIVGFKVLYISFPEHSEVVRFIRMAKATIYINTAAVAGANVVQLIQ